MKKILLVLLVILLAGCFEDSGKLTKSCVLEDNSSIISTKTTYTFTFKQDIIEQIKVLEEYYSDENTISSIKLSISTQNAFLDLDYNIISDTIDEFKIEYNLPLQGNDVLNNKFVIKEKRSELVKILKEKGFSCN